MHAETRALIEELWVQFQPVCGDPHAHFLRDARTNFHQRTWELLLAGVLANAGFRSRRQGGMHPTC